MCGITAALIGKPSNKYWELLKASEIRGQDGTGLTLYMKDSFNNSYFRHYRWNTKASDIKETFEFQPTNIVIGQNRLAIFGLNEKNNQPLTTERFSLVHNGNLVDFESVFKQYSLKRELQVDTELILRILEKENPKTIEHLEFTIMQIQKLKGDMACFLLDRKLKLLVVFNKYKPIWWTDTEDGRYFFSTERIGRKVFTTQLYSLIPFSIHTYDLETSRPENKV